MADIGPGKTQFVPNEDGSISVRRWNDPAWTTHFMDASELNDEGLAATNVAYLLARAYQMGMDDKRDLIKQALEVR